MLFLPWSGNSVAFMNRGGTVWPSGMLPWDDGMSLGNLPAPVLLAVSVSVFLVFVALAMADGQRFDLLRLPHISGMQGYGPFIPIWHLLKLRSMYRAFIWWRRKNSRTAALRCILRHCGVRMYASSLRISAPYIWGFLFSHLLWWFFAGTSLVWRTERLRSKALSSVSLENTQILWPEQIF